MLDLNLSTIIWEIVNFLIITVVLYFLVFKPMTKRAEARALEKAANKAALERDVEEAAEKLREIEDRLSNLDQEVQVITDEAYSASQVLQNELLEATRQEADQIMLNAVQEARKEQAIDIKKNQIELVDTVLTISNQTLRSVTPKSVHEGLLEELHQTVWNLGKTDMRTVQNIRDALATRSATIDVTLPYEPTPQEHAKMLNSFYALADKEVDLNIIIDPNLIAGVKAHVGDIVLDNSLVAQLENLRDDVTKSLETFTMEEND